MIIAARPTFFCIFATACCMKSNCISPVAGRPAGNLPSFPFLCSLRTAFSTPSPASLPPQDSPKGGLAMTKRISVSSKQSSFIVSAKRMFSAAWFLINISARQIAWDSGLFSCPNRRTLASGFIRTIKSCAVASIPPVPQAISNTVTSRPSLKMSLHPSASKMLVRRRITSRGV